MHAQSHTLQHRSCHSRSAQSQMRQTMLHWTFSYGIFWDMLISASCVTCTQLEYCTKQHVLQRDHDAITFQFRFGFVTNNQRGEASHIDSSVNLMEYSLSTSGGCIYAESLTDKNENDLLCFGELSISGVLSATGSTTNVRTGQEILRTSSGARLSTWMTRSHSPDIHQLDC